MIPANEYRHDMPKKKWKSELVKAIPENVDKWNHATLDLHFDSSHEVKIIVIIKMLFQNPHLKKMRNKTAMLTG